MEWVRDFTKLIMVDCYSGFVTTVGGGGTENTRERKAEQGDGIRGATTTYTSNT